MEARIWPCSCLPVSAGLHSSSRGHFPSTLRLTEANEPSGARHPGPRHSAVAHERCADHGCRCRKLAALRRGCAALSWDTASFGTLGRVVGRQAPNPSRAGGPYAPLPPRWCRLRAPVHGQEILPGHSCQPPGPGPGSRLPGGPGRASITPANLAPRSLSSPWPHPGRLSRRRAGTARSSCPRGPPAGSESHPDRSRRRCGTRARPHGAG
jgi:hypothetical protein